MSHSHDGPHNHSHDHAAADHGHTHEILEGPGSYMGREMPLIEGRDWSERAFTVGIGGYANLFIVVKFTLVSKERIGDFADLE
jgi:hypothetical protein